MKIILLIFLKALALYLVITLPAIAEPVIYELSAFYAATSGLLALVVFIAAFYILHLTKASYNRAVVSLLLIIPVAVGVAYKALILVIMPGRYFFEIDGYTLFPLLAVFAGWVSILVSLPRIKEHFTPFIITEIETISVHP